MSEFSKLLDQFKEHQDDLKNLGNQLVEKYPQSKTLLQLSRDLSSAIDGVDALRQKLQDTLEQADQESRLKKDLLDQMNQSDDLYDHLTPADRNKLAEFLLQNNTGLADRKQLMEFIQKAMAEKSNEDLIAEFTKDEIKELGQMQGTEGEDGFDSYQSGVKLLTDRFNDPAKRTKMLEDLAEYKMDHKADEVLKSFFQKAFQA